MSKQHMALALFMRRTVISEKTHRCSFYDGGEATVKVVFAVKSGGFVLNKGESHVGRVD
jgi:hypothetical protein